jgi:type II secretory pathway pseudopilin PulG
MVIALVVVAVLLFVAIVLLSISFGSVSDERAIRAKIAAFDAAEAGINEALDELDRAHGQVNDCGPDGNGRQGNALADGGRYTLCIAWNSMAQGKGNNNVADPGTGHSIAVPDNMAFAWSLGASEDGGRSVLVEAMIAPSTGLPLPSGVINAAGDVDRNGQVGVYASAIGANDAIVHSNSNMYDKVAASNVHGSTFAVGVDQIPGVGGMVNSNAAPVAFPTNDQMTAAAQNAEAEAKAGAPIMSPPSDSGIMTGNIYIAGDLDLRQGTVMFEHGRSVFINGNLCIHSRAQVVNDGATIWVSGTVSTDGTGSGYVLAPGSMGTLIVLGTDNAQTCSNANAKYAVILDSGGSGKHIGLVYAPNGSIEVVGNGNLIGAVAAGGNVELDGSKGNGIQFDPTVPLTVPTYDFKIVSYMEY